MGVASLAINALAARTMGPAGRGSLALFLQLTYLANLLAMAGTDRSYSATVPLGRGARNAAADVLRLVAPCGLVVLLLFSPVVYAAGAHGADGADGGLLVLSGFAITTSALLSAQILRTGAAAAGVVHPPTSSPPWSDSCPSWPPRPCSRCPGSSPQEPGCWHTAWPSPPTYRRCSSRWSPIWSSYPVTAPPGRRWDPPSPTAVVPYSPSCRASSHD